MNEWQPIETAPKDGRWILAWCDSYSHEPPFADVTRWKAEVAEHWEYVDADTKKRIVRDSGYWEHCDGYPTHWMPLPDPPVVASVTDQEP